MSQTGGTGKPWLFDVNDFELLEPIRNQLVHVDTYFDEEHETNTLAIVMDKILDDLPEEYADCVRLVFLEGRTLRDCGRTLGIDHKTVKSRADKGVEMMRQRLLDSVWIAEMLRGYIPSDETKETSAKSSSNVASVMKDLKKVPYE